jgi:magnesium chelatase family protein
VSSLRDRIRAAMINSGLPWPTQAISVTVDPPLRGPRSPLLDTAIAAAVLAAASAVPAAHLHSVGLLGELGLDGRLRPLPAADAAAAARAARAAGLDALLVAAQTDHPSTDSSAALISVADLSSLATRLLNGPLVSAAIRRADVSAPQDQNPHGDAQDPDDLTALGADLPGRREVELAAAGGHHLLLLGTAGSSKTLLARWLRRLLPPLNDQAAQKVADIHAAAGPAAGQPPASRQPPFLAPHHTSSLAMMFGTGRRPGAVALAHHGVLFLQDAPEFPTRVLQALRRPLDHGDVLVSHGGNATRHPARLQLILSATPCACGTAVGALDAECRCTDADRRRYLSRLTLTLLDRIDIRADLDHPLDATIDPHLPAEPDADVAARVAAARAAAGERLRGTEASCNAQIPDTDVLGRWAPPASAMAAADRAHRAGLLSERGRCGLLRLAWTLADLAGRTSPTAHDIADAVQLRLPPRQA